jgi:hypothetical protein
MLLLGVSRKKVDEEEQKQGFSCEKRRERDARVEHVKR